MRTDDLQPWYPWPAADASGLPLPRIPFPVSAPYRPRPGLARLADATGERGVLDADGALPTILRAKLDRLRTVPERCAALAPALRDDARATWRRVAAAADALLRAEEAFRARAAAARGEGDGESEGEGDRDGDAPSTGMVGRAPGRSGRADPTASDVDASDGDASMPLRRDGDAFVAPIAGWAMPADPDAPFELRALRADAEPVLAWIASRPPAERPLHALGLALQEDLAWIEAPASDRPAVAAMLHVCFPSGWDPARKAGLDFASIHAPVADGDALRAASAPLSRALLSAGPFLRHVWTLAPRGALARHPAEPEPGGDPAAIWFRCERQVSVPIGPVPGGGEAGAALFLIRLHVAPLDATAPPGGARRRALEAALASMSDATVEYKRLGAIRARMLGGGASAYDAAPADDAARGG